jgi:hypothetical protein
MLEIWVSYWWAITLVALYAKANFLSWTNNGEKAKDQRRLKQELLDAYEIKDDEERLRAKALIKNHDHAYYTRQDSKIATRSIPFLLNIIIFLLAGILAKMSG